MFRTFNGKQSDSRLYALWTIQVYLFFGPRAILRGTKEEPMNILDAILSAQNGAAAREAGRSVGLSQEQTITALSALVPALAAGLQRNATQEGGLDALLGALGRGAHARYVDQPQMQWSQETLADGNGILGHILGSKDVSRAVATQAATHTGIGPDVLKKFLPLAATLVMGSLAKQYAGRPASTTAAGGTDIVSMLTPVLDQNRDGSMVDDILKSVGRMLGGR
jgi:hypothetical protein